MRPVTLEVGVCSKNVLMSFDVSGYALVIGPHACTPRNFNSYITRANHICGRHLLCTPLPSTPPTRTPPTSPKYNTHVNSRTEVLIIFTYYKINSTLSLSGGLKYSLYLGEMSPHLSASGKTRMANPLLGESTSLGKIANKPYQLNTQ